MGNGRGEFFLVHSAITNDHCIIKNISLLLHRHVDDLASVNLLACGLKSNIRKNQRALRRHLDGIITINVCHYYLTGLVNSHTDTYQRFPARVSHRTGYLCLLG